MTSFLRFTRMIESELAPYPGRTVGSLRDTLSMVLALVLAYTLRVPGIGLALALILLLQRESPGMTFRNALQIFSGAVFACISCLVWVQITDGTEAFRFLGFVLGVYIAGFCMTATRYPLFFTIFGFYGFVDLSGWDAHRSANAVVTTMLFNVAALGLALGMAALVHFLSVRTHPAEDLDRELEKRLRSLAAFHRELANPARRAGMSAAHHRLVQYSQAGVAPLIELYTQSRNADSDSQPIGTRFRIGLLVRAMQRSTVHGFSSQGNSEAHERIAELCEHILEDRQIDPVKLSPQAPPALREVFEELRRYDDANADGELTESYAPANARLRLDLFHSDAFSSPEAAIYSLKLTLCATICYVIYNAIAWPGILTCVVTVLFTGLTSTGAMKQKQIYRLAGAAVGGLLAIQAESLLFPNMDSITSLVIITGLICLLSAWVSRSPRVGYVGVQIAFAFFLTDLAGFGAASQISPARDRVIGIALGVFVMWFVFDQIWPTRPSHLLTVLRDRMQRNAGRMCAEMPAGAVDSMREEVAADLAQMQVLSGSAFFDFGSHHRREMARTRRLTRETELAAARFYEKLHARRLAQDEI